MTSQEIKSIKMGTILTWNPTGELFKVTGFNLINKIITKHYFL